MSLLRGTRRRAWGQKPGPGEGLPQRDDGSPRSALHSANPPSHEVQDGVTDPSRRPRVSTSAKPSQSRTSHPCSPLAECANAAHSQSMLQGLWQVESGEAASSQLSERGMRLRPHTSQSCNAPALRSTSQTSCHRFSASKVNDQAMRLHGQWSCAQTLNAACLVAPMV